MTAQNPRNQKPRPRRGLGCGLTATAVFLIALCAVAFFLIRTRLSADVVSTWITAPVTDQQVEVNQPLTVLAGAAYPSGMSRVEVYADGALILAKDSTGQGETELSVTGDWIPLTSGSHVLVARGFAGNDQYADSEVVYVDVLEPSESIIIDVDGLPGEENPSLDALAGALGTTPEELIRRNPSLGGNSPSAPVPPGSRVEGPRPPGSPPSPPSPPPPSPGNPAAPTGLSGTADCISASLTWAASPDAQSYRVYRLGPGETRPSLRVDGLRSTTYLDRLLGPGVYLYQIASVRNGHEGFSPVFRVTTPAGCTTIGAPPGADLILTAAMVDTDSIWEGIYCYIAVNDEAHNHIPEGDSSYQPPEASNNKYYNLTRLPGGGRWYLPSQQPTSPVTFFSECWGRRGPNSTLLGSFLVSHPQAEWDGRLRSASGGAYRFTYCLGPSSTPCTPTVPGGVATTSRDLSDRIVSLAIPPPTNLRRTASTAACEDLPNFMDRLACRGSGFLCLFGGCEGRQTVFWDWTETPFVPESSLTGYTVVRTTYDQSTGRMLMNNLWDVNRRDGSLPKRFLSEDRDLHCGQRVMYRVQANQAARHSVLSDPISFNTALCASAANVMITFDTLQVGTVNDAGEEYFMGIPDPAGNANLEVQGYIYTVDGRADTQASTIYQNSVNGIYHPLEQGTSRWSTLVHVNSFSTLVLNNSQTLTIGAVINEVDTEWTRTVIRRTTPWCVVEMVLRARSLEDWGRLNQPITLNGGTSEASCTITGRVVGTPASVR